VQVVAALLIGGVGVPVPEELALLSAGYFIANGSDPRVMIAAAIAAVLAGDLMMYAAGRCGIQIGVARRLAGSARLVRLRAAFSRHGAKLLLAGRFVPGVRAALLVAAGAAHLPVWRLLVYDGAAALAGATLWITLGARLAAHLDRARAIVAAARGALMAAAAVALTVIVLGACWPRLRAWLALRPWRTPDRPGSAARLAVPPRGTRHSRAR
jgi:membrane protein DedA with SNARE-associated domain